MIPKNWRLKQIQKKEKKNKKELSLIENLIWIETREQINIMIHLLQPLISATNNTAFKNEASALN